MGHLASSRYKVCHYLDDMFAINGMLNDKQKV